MAERAERLTRPVPTKASTDFLREHAKSCCSLVNLTRDQSSRPSRFEAPPAGDLPRFETLTAAARVGMRPACRAGLVPMLASEGSGELVRILQRSPKEGGCVDAPTPPTAGPLHQVSGGLNTEYRPVTGAHGEQVRNSKSAAGSQRDQDIVPAALIRCGESVLPSARFRDATASREGKRPAGAPALLVRRTDGVATVAQPGSAPRSPRSEVARSNRAGGSTNHAGLCSAEQRVRSLGSSSPEETGVFAEVKLLGWSANVALLGERSAFNPRGAGSTPAGGAAAGSPAALRARNSFDVGGVASVIVLAGLVRHEQPASVICERQRGTRSRSRELNGVGCVRRSSSAFGVSTRAGLQRARVGAAVERQQAAQQKWGRHV